MVSETFCLRYLRGLPRVAQLNSQLTISPPHHLTNSSLHHFTTSSTHRLCLDLVFGEYSDG